MIKKYDNVDKDADAEEKAPVISKELARQKEKANKIDDVYYKLKNENPEFAEELEKWRTQAFVQE